MSSNDQSKGLSYGGSGDLHKSEISYTKSEISQDGVAEKWRRLPQKWLLWHHHVFGVRCENMAEIMVAR
jgi:hypothetical protein